VALTTSLGVLGLEPLDCPSFGESGCPRLVGRGDSDDPARHRPRIRAVIVDHSGHRDV